MKHTLIRTVSDEPQEAFSGCGQGPIPAARRERNAPSIFVNGVEVPEPDIAREAQNHFAASAAEARAAAARALVIRELLLQRAHALGLTAAPEIDERGRSETDAEALVRAVLEREVDARQPTDEECRRVYESAPERFTADVLFEASHILFAPAANSEAAWAEANAQACAALAALNAGAKFADLAQEHSACPTAVQGGALGQLQQGDLSAEVESAILSLRPGEIAPAPVRTRYGWHVVRLDRIIPARVLPYEAAGPQIRAMLHHRAWTVAAARYVSELAAQAEIEGVSLSIGGGQ